MSCSCPGAPIADLPMVENRKFKHKFGTRTEGGTGNSGGATFLLAVRKGTTKALYHFLPAESVDSSHGEGT